MATEAPRRQQGNPRHEHSRCVLGALRDAEKVCKKRGVNLTPIRRQVLEIVWQGHQPVKAYEIIENFGSTSHPTAPPTVYRALDFLMENGLVHRIESQNAFVGCSHPISTHKANFFICESCHQATEIDSKRLEASFEQLAADNCFKIKHKTVEIYGLCANCKDGGKAS